MRTTILLFHPDPDRSRANCALASAARALSTVEIVDMQRLYSNCQIDVEREVARLLEQHPIG
jgi:putative NADPH-quinone reductase